MSLIAIYGGSFDPIHNGHVTVINAITTIASPDELLIFPSKVSPNKTSVIASDSDRIEMINLALSSINHGSTLIKIDPFELTQPAPSYTIRTIRHLKNKYPENTQLALVIGYDNYQHFHLWDDYEQVLTLLKQLLIVNRPGFEQRNAILEAHHHHKIKFITTKEIPISSSQIRQELSQKNPISTHVPEAVRQYIYTQNLYQTQ